MIRSADEFIKLRLSDYPEEYNQAATDAAPLEVWLDIIECYPDMRSWVAHNKSIPIEILAILAKDSDPQVRGRVAMKRKLPEHLQLLLAQDADDGVRHQLVYNAKATKTVLELLSKDLEPSIREKAIERLGQK